MDDVDARQSPLESATQILRADVIALERELTGATQQISALEVAAEDLKDGQQDNVRRLLALEQDERVPELMQMLPKIDDVEDSARVSIIETNEKINKIIKKVRLHSFQGLPFKYGLFKQKVYCPLVLSMNAVKWKYT